MARVTIWLYVERSDLTVEELTALIGVQPDETWRIGDRRGKTGKTYQTNSWCLQSVAEVNENPSSVGIQIEHGLNEIITRMRDAETRFKSVAASGNAGVYVGVFAEENPVLALKAELIQAIAMLGVGVEIDLIG